MKGSKKMIAVTLGTIGSIALISSSIYAAAGDGGKAGFREPTAAVKGNGAANSSEELAKKLGISIEELESQIRRNAFSISEATTFTGKVNNDVHTKVEPGEAETKKPASSTTGDGTTYTPEELAKKLGKSINELGDQDQLVELPLTEAVKQSGNVNNGVHTPAAPAESESKKPTASTKGNGKAFTSEDIDVNESKGQGIELSLGES